MSSKRMAPRAARLARLRRVGRRGGNDDVIQARRLKWICLLGLTCFTGPVAALHVLRPELDPRSRFLSEYAIGPYSALWAASLFALGLGSFALRIGLGRALPDGQPRGARALLTAWCCGAIVAGIFPTDPGGVPVSAAGIIHGIAASVGFVSFVVAALLLSARFGRDAHRHPARRPALALAMLALASLFAFFGAPVHLKGVTERIFVLAVVAWLGYVALRLPASGQAQKQV